MTTKSTFVGLVALLIACLTTMTGHAEQWVEIPNPPNKGVQIDQDSAEAQPDGHIKLIWLDQQSPSLAAEYVSVVSCQDFSMTNIQRTTIHPGFPVGHPLRRGKPYSYGNLLSPRVFGSAFEFPWWTSNSGLAVRTVCKQFSQAIPIATGALSPCPPGLATALSVFACSGSDRDAANFGVFMKRIEQVETACGTPKTEIQYATYLELSKADTCKSEDCKRLLFRNAMTIVTDDLTLAAEGKTCTSVSAAIENEANRVNHENLVNAVAGAYIRCARSEIVALDDTTSAPKDVAVAVNLRCRSVLKNDDITFTLATALERELTQNNTLLIFEKRAAVRQQQNKQPKPKRPAPTT